MFDVSENAVSLWERKNAVPAAYDQWLRMSLLAKFEGKTKLADAIQRVQSVQALVPHKWLVKALKDKRTVTVVSI